MAETKLTLLRPMRYKYLCLALSLSVIIPGLISLMLNGLQLGIDFTGGSSWIWQVRDLPESEFRQDLATRQVQLTQYGYDGSQLSLTTSPIEPSLYADLKSRWLSTGQELSFASIGPSLGAELLRKTLIGLALASTLILSYIAYRFRSLKYGVSAILAMVHDLLVVLGIFSLLGKFWGVQLDTLFVTALLTILSFSVHDTIVVYDRIRELQKKHHYLDYEEIVNRAVVETMGRSLNNSMTIIFMLLTMYLLGGESIRWFILALLVGTVSGTYSSTFTAAPLIVIWHNWQRRKQVK